MKKLFNWFRMYSAGVATPPDNTEAIDRKEFEMMFAAEEEEEWDENR